MTDEELIELVQAKIPEELSRAEANELRRRLPKSAALQQALAGRLEMEQYLADSLGRFSVSVDQILARGSQSGPPRWYGIFSVAGWIVCLGLIGFIFLVLVMAIVKPPGWPNLGDVARGGKANVKQDADDDSSDEKTPDGQAAAEDPADGGSKPDEAAATDPAKPMPGATQPAAVNPPPAADLPPWERLAGGAAEGAQALFDEVGPKIAPPRDTDLKRWFAAVNGQPFNVGQRDLNGLQCGEFNGIGRLVAPWKPKTALRLTIFDYPNLKLHFWNGDTGVTFQCYGPQPENQTWVAYGTTRKADEPRPATYALMATDEDRYWRTNAVPNSPVTLELRYEAGLLTLSRGDVRVLSAPLASAPSEVYFEGHAVFRQLAMARAAELPAEPPRRPIAIDVAKPSELAWMGELSAGIDFHKLPDGRVELVAEKNNVPGWVAVPVPRGGLYEIVVHLDNPAPGTGIYLGDAQGQPRYPVGFFREQRTGWTSFGWVPPGDARLDTNFDINNGPAPYSLASPWLRLVYNCGSFKCWTSADGVHWGRAFEPWNQQSGPFHTFGLYCVQAQPRHGITLARIQFRELAALDSLASAELRATALELPQSQNLVEWLQKVNELAPADVEGSKWRRACALATLARGTSNALGIPLVENLLNAALADKLPAEQKLALLDEGALLLPTWEDGGLAARLNDRYERLGRLLYRQGEPHPYRAVARRQLAAPLWSRPGFKAYSERLLQEELFEQLYAGHWDDVHDLCRQTRFWRPTQPYQPPALLDWADALAVKYLPNPTAADVLAMQNDWRHPVSVELSKEGFNVLAELQAALAGKAYDDACQIISSASQGGLSGLLPDARDPELLTSLSGAVAIAMREHPALATTMSEKFGPLGRLRVRQAIVDADAEALEAATLHFYGTEAAAEAHAWLGDRALSIGAFAHALGHYRQARPTAGKALKNRIAAAEQIASAMLGGKAGELPTSTVELGETRLSPGELKSLVDDLREHHAADVLSKYAVSAIEAQPAPAPIGFDVVVHEHVDGDLHRNPDPYTGELNQQRSDWVARQYSFKAGEQRLVLANCFQISSFDPASGKLQWHTPVGEDPGNSSEWSLLPMRPLVTPSRIVARSLTKQGPVLVCLESTTGKPVWTSKAEPEKAVISDPLFVHNELLALTAVHTEQGYFVALATYDPQTGTLLGERTLLQLREPWWRQRVCQVAAHEDAIYVTCGGSVLCCDLLGQVRWLRRQVWLPPALDSYWCLQSHDLPLVMEGKLFVQQPGVRSVSCLDADSGRLVWQRVVPGVRRIVGHVAERLVVQTDEGLVALDAATGQPSWYFDSPSLLDAQLCGGPGGLLITRADRLGQENYFSPTLVWLDPQTGRQQAHWPLAALKHERPKFGPLLVRKDRLWALFGREDQNLIRDMVELVPKGNPLPIETQREATASWARR